eukprot:TRINITY_DN460_c0_g1_i1.p1 TRINITY_DN460_c0_g1~~TRINITY_DN460_c0_g1_i1.p1  ORF type:complete len:268 (-),score=52.73 TRINITY_DN460_c0_g1_i1:71-874(-)
MERFIHKGTKYDWVDKEVYRGAAAEFINLFLFTFISGGCVVAATGATAHCVKSGLEPASLVAIALAHGFTITFLVYATGNISGGHINPAVTIALFVAGVISISRTILYVIAQVSGAIVGSLFLAAILPTKFEGNLGCTTLNPEMNSGQGVGLEMFTTFVLMFVIFMTAVDEQGAGQMAPLAIGLVVVVDHLIAVPWTGASMNPARSFGPAVASNTCWKHHWIYWIGPIVGAVFAAVVYSILFLRREIPEKTEDEGKPQYDLHSRGIG